MTANEVYVKLLQKVNENFTNDNIALDKSRAYLHINEAQNKYVEWTLQKRNDDSLRDIQRLLVDDKSLEFLNKHLQHSNYKLPENYFDFSNITVFATKGKCQNKPILPIEIKDENKNLLEFDYNNKPSFEYRETFYNLSDDSVKIYFSDFNITRVYLSYYRYPKKINFEGYIMADGSPSTNSDPEWDDRQMDRIISIAAKDFNTVMGRQTIDIDKDRIISKN